MDYDLRNLGEKQFEHLAQALLVSNLGADIDIYGAGPDGGREATWEGPCTVPENAPNLLPGRWDGYNVAQAKYCNNVGNTRTNAAWITNHIKREFDEWTDPDTKRSRKPESYLIITNVKLSAVPRTGVDKVSKVLLSYAADKGLPLKSLSIWHYDKIRVLLDNSADIRAAYTAWITPGDVLSRILDSSSTISENFRTALQTHAAKLLIDDVRLNLTQAGSVSDGSIDVADVYIELPANPIISEHATQPFDGNVPSASMGITEELIATANQKLDSIAIKAEKGLSRSCRIVLIGGPGQGKSTVTQYLTQLYRAFFIKDTPVVDTPEVRSACESVKNHATTIDIAHPIARRWPVRITLTELADSLSKEASASVLEYLSSEISKRSSMIASLANLRAWLKLYPWLVIFDGLDEVPESSNRSEVLKAISDFYIDARGLEADIVIITTTRPQGYNNDFNKIECRHYELEPLPLEIARSYAHSLINRRLGEDSDRSRRVRSRLEKAFADESTSILTSTPLQTTILTILVERIGTAPKDRWRLFSNYYRVIYQREQEKGGLLAEILEEYESDIHAIHFEIGFILQRRGESSGDATSSISKSDFAKIISERMRVNGNSRTEADRLADQITKVATDRLVFLAVLRSNAVGFEIRSLQEYMAAERIVTGPEGAIESDIRSIAESDYWQNVLLFVAGNIFANKNHLCSTIVTLCHDLNTASTAHTLAHLGSNLAYALLVERVASKKPVYSRLLASMVVDLQKYPPDERISAKVAHIAELGHPNEVKIALRQAIASSATQRLSAALTLSMLEERGTAWANGILADLVNSAPKELQRELIHLAGLHEQLPLLRHLTPILAGMNFRSVVDLHIEHFGHSWFRLTSRIEGFPEYLKGLGRYNSQFDDDDYEGNTTTHIYLKGLRNLNVSLDHLKHATSNLLMQGDYAGDDPTWRTVAAISKFAAGYSADDLACALTIARTMDIPSLVGIAQGLPWPFNICLEELAGYPDGNESGELQTDCVREYRDARAAELISAARRGDLGNTEMWRALAQSPPKQIDISTISQVGSKIGEITGVPLPVGESLSPAANIFASFPTFSYTFSEGNDDIVEWIQSSAEPISELQFSTLQRKLLELTRFLASVFTRSNIYRDSRGKRQNTTAGAVRIPLTGNAMHSIMQVLGRYKYLGSTAWLTLADKSGTYTFDDILSEFLKSGKVVSDSPLNAEDFLSRWSVGKIPWRIAGLLLTAHILPVEYIDRVDFTEEDNPEAAERCRYAMEISRILNAESQAELDAWMSERLPILMMSDKMERESAYYPASTQEPFGITWLVQRLENGLTYSQLPFVAEIVVQLISVHPRQVDELMDEIAQIISSQTAAALSFE
ncbi:NACHT domain-containing protein [Nocardia sp. CA-128927]|uniref:NACHT domain-containing protein n=1 Tax=Nocardia sp. CA-128927 TaxID=3239975 RepID=UPI003D9620A9